MVTVGLVYDVNFVPDLAGLVVDLNYPEGAVSIPGSGSDESVLIRVTDVSSAHGLAVIEDRDTDDDGTDDQIHNAYVTSGNIPPGDFEHVVFDCIDGAPPPAAAAFTCVVSDPVDSGGNSVTGVSCENIVVVTLAPTPTAAPASATPTATATAPPPTPTPIPMCTTLDVTVGLVYDVGVVPELAGLAVALDYPATVTLPGSGSDDSVTARVTDISDAHGLLNVEDRDTDTDGTDDQLGVVYVSSSNIAPGDFLRVHFDCVPDSTIPMVNDFHCAASDTVDPQGNPVDGVACSVTANASDTLHQRAAPLVLQRSLKEAFDLTVRGVVGRASHPAADRVIQLK